MRRLLLLSAVVALSLASACDDDSNATTPTTPTPAPPVTSPPAPVPTAAPKPVTTAPVLLVVKLTPTPAEGEAPFTLDVNLCQSRPQPPVDDFPLTFTANWGDGGRHVRTFCRDQHTYENAGTYRATFCASDGVEGHDSCKNVTVRVD
jgi:hypothetical protein